MGQVAQVAITASIFAVLGPVAGLFQVGVAVNVLVYMAVFDYILHYGEGAVLQHQTLSNSSYKVALFSALVHTSSSPHFLIHRHPSSPDGWELHTVRTKVWIHGN